MKKVFETPDDYYSWVNEEEDNMQDTVDTLFEYVAQLMEEKKALEEYKWMYESLCE